MPVKNDPVVPEKTEPVVEEMKTTPPPTETSKQDAPAQKSTEADKPQSYVHLADGSVLRVFDEDMPIGGGTGTPHGHWQRGNKVYQVIGVYPVETVVEES